MPDIQKQISARVDSFVAELSHLVRQAALEAVNQTLGGNGSTPGRGRRQVARVPRVAARGRGGKRSPKALASLTGKLGSAIAARPGLRIEEIGKRMGARTKDLALPIRKLLASGAIRRTGQKRATKYFSAKK